MSIKSILFSFNGTVPELNALSSVLSLARVHRASLRVLHVAAPPVLPDTLGIGSYAVAAYGDSAIVDILERDARELTLAASAYVTAYCKQEAVPLMSPGEHGVMGQSQARFRVVTGTVGLCLPAESYTADLVVAGYDNSPSGDLDIVMTTLFQAGRPILLYPHMPAVDVVGQGPARTVVFAWDGSRPAGRALREAVPHMLHADKVCLLRVGEDTSNADVIAEQDVMAYLRSHCVGAELVRVGRNHGVGRAILDAADSLGADLVAMGAYGHSHLGEMLLGGATDYVLKHGNLPLLLAH